MEQVTRPLNRWLVVVGAILIQLALGAIYAWSVFTAYGIAGIAGPLLAGYFKDSAQGDAQPVVWMAPFIVAGAACLLGAVIMAFTTRPQHVSQSGAVNVGGGLAPKTISAS
jgi:sugar phosphate permease